MSGLSDAERELLLEDDLALSNLHAGWGRDVLYTAVERIVQQRERAAVDAALSPIEALLALYESWDGSDPLEHPGSSSPQQRDDLRDAIRDGRAT